MIKETKLDSHRDTALDRTEAALLEHLSDRFSLRKKSLVLSFPEPLEHSFYDYWLEQSLSRFRAFCLVSLAAVLVLGLADFWLQPQLFAAVWQVRLPIVVILAVIATASYIPALKSQQIPGTFVVQLTLCLGGWSFFALSSPEAKVFHYAAAAFWPMLALVLSGCLLKWAVVITSVNLFFSNVYLSLMLPAEIFSMGAHTLYYVSAASTVLLLIHILEKTQREVYLQVQQANISKFDSSELDANRGRLQFLVALDSVTGVANRKSLDRALKNEWDRAARQNYSLSLLLVDMDGFKEFNKQYGQKVADEALRKVAIELKRFARRQGDIAARFDSDCFAILLADTKGLNAGTVAQSIAANVLALNDEESPEIISVSIGVGSLSPSPKTFPADLIGSSVCALKAAKKRGPGTIYNLAE